MSRTPKHMSTPGEIGVFPLDTDGVARFGPGAYAIVRGKGGFMYLLTVEYEEEDGENIATSYALHQVMDRGPEPRGALVSRKRFTREDVVYAIAHELKSEGIEPTTEAMAEVYIESWSGVGAGVIARLLAVVGVDVDADEKSYALEGPAVGSTSAPSTAKAIDDVWVDDDWHATTDEIAERIASKLGMSVAPDTIKKTLSRGPFVSDGGRPAKWTRTPSATTPKVRSMADEDADA